MNELLDQLIEFWRFFVTQALELMPQTDTLMGGTFLALAAAVVLVPVMSRIKLGTMLGYLAAGILVGPYGLGAVREVESIMHFAEFGIVLMMFLIGLELDLGRLWKMRIRVFGGGALQMVLCAAPFAWLLHRFGLALPAAVLAGLAVAMSSTAVAVQEMTSRSLMAQPVGRDAFSVLLFQDLASIPLIAAIPAVAAATGAAAAAAGAADSTFGQTALKAGIALVLMVGVGRLLTVPLLNFMIRSGAREMLTAFSLVLTVSAAWIMQAAGLSSAMGGFIGGLLLGSSGFRHQLEAEISTFKQLLLGLFFITVGMSIDLNLVASQPLVLLAALGLLLGTKIVMLFVTACVMRLKGMPARASFAVLLSQGGEFAFVVFALARTQNVLPAETTAVLTGAVAISMGTTPVLMQLLSSFTRWRENRKGSFITDDRAELEAAPARSVIIAGYGDFGALVARLLVACGLTPIIIDNDPDRVRQAKLFGVKVYYGDAGQLALLTAAGAADARILVVSVGDDKRALEIIDIAREAYPALKIIAPVNELENQLEFLSRGVECELLDLESSLRAARRCLTTLGLASAYEAREVADIFRHFTERSVRMMSDTHASLNDAIAAYRMHDGVLQSILRQIRALRRERLAAVANRERKPAPVQMAFTLEGDDMRPGEDTSGVSPEERLAMQKATGRARRRAMDALAEARRNFPEPNPEKEMTVSQYFDLYRETRDKETPEAEAPKRAGLLARTARRLRAAPAAAAGSLRRNAGRLKSAPSAALRKSRSAATSLLGKVSAKLRKK